MSETPSQPRTTPARKRQGRGNGRPAAHKAYASENDVATMDMSRYEQTPRTPQKFAGVDSPGPHSHQAGNKQRSRNSTNTNPNTNAFASTSASANSKQPRQKNTSNSPEATRQGGRHTPPHNQSAMKSNIPAFAGATFHASPAPSALPLPSFAARPPSDSPSLKAAREVVQQPSPPTDVDAPTPSHLAAARPAQESPLDFMFRAHRQERERRQNSPATTRPMTSAADSPSRSPFDPASVPKPASVPQATRSAPRFQASGIGSAELDGTPGRPMGPAFSTPYQERIKAARSNVAQPPAHQQQTQYQPEATTLEDPTVALKKFLFGGGSAPSGSNLGSNAYYAPRSAQPMPTELPSSPVQPAPNMNGAHGGRPNNIQAMEDDLRRILKLDLATGPATERRLFS